MSNSTFSIEGILLQVVIAAILIFLWRRDYQVAKRVAAPAQTPPPAGVNTSGEDASQSNRASGFHARQMEAPPAALPGATPCPSAFLLIAALGALLLTFLETAGEHLLGVSAEQKNIPAIFLAAMLGAAITEEIVFRGFLVISSKGRPLLLASVFAASLAFALLHDFLWTFEAPADAAWWEFWLGFSFQFSLKNLHSTAFVFAASLYFYALRFHPANPLRSLLPCFAAHATRNLAVFLVKLAEGHITGL
jgi:membrane protease YdiL (CAAX protease family)